MATDPVCGMYVDERSAELRLVRENRTYYFCAERCLAEFAQPERELSRLRRRLAWAAPLAAVVVGLTYARPFAGWPWAALGLAAIVQAYPGAPFYRGLWDAARARRWNMDVLIAVGTSAAFGYSAVAVLLPGRLPAEYFFDASALIVTLLLAGSYLEHLTRERSRGALRGLAEMLPTTAWRLAEGEEQEVPVEELRAGDRIRVRPGARIPADGTVLEGRSSVDEALLNGEAAPVAKGPGDPVTAGARNGDGPLLLRADRVGPDTFLSGVARLVTEAETSRVPLQRLADRIAAGFVPAVLVLAGVAAAAWLAEGQGIPVAVLVFVAVVITACPCAFGLATPAAIVVGTGRAAEEGVLFSGRDSLERASEVDVVVLDKTGTLTAGRPRLSAVRPAVGVTEEELLGLAAGLERGSEHPLARAVLEGARARAVPPRSVEELRTEPGVGVNGRIGSVEVSVRRGPGDPASAGVPAGLRAEAERLDREGESWSMVVREGRPIGLLGFGDPVAEGAPEAIAALREDGIRVLVASGDRPTAVERVAGPLGLRELHAGCAPSEKVALVRRLQSEGHRVAFVGDGINDAPALASADLGIAIGAGTEVARESAGVVLVRDDLRGAALALRVGRRTVRKVRGNLTWAVGYNAVLLPVSMGALVPWLGVGTFALLPIAGAIAMALSSTSVVVNSLSLQWVSLGGAGSRAGTPNSSGRRAAPR